MNAVSFQYWSLLKFWAQGPAAGEKYYLVNEIKVLDVIFREVFLAVVCASCCICRGVEGE